MMMDERSYSWISVKKSSQESISTQQIQDNFYGQTKGMTDNPNPI